MRSADDGLSLRVSSSPILSALTAPDLRIESIFDEKSQKRRSRRQWKPKQLFAIRSLGAISLAVALVLVCYMAMDRYLTPHLEILVAEKKLFQKEISALKKQLSNVSRVAESRLEMNNLLQKQIERQTTHSANDESTPNPFFFSTIVSTFCCSMFISSLVSYKIYFVLQHEKSLMNRRMKSRTIAKESVETTFLQPSTQSREESEAPRSRHEQTKEQNDNFFRLISIPDTGCIV